MSAIAPGKQNNTQSSLQVLRLACSSVQKSSVPSNSLREAGFWKSEVTRREIKCFSTTNKALAGNNSIFKEFYEGR
jgi:hypothetical protein